MSTQTSEPPVQQFQRREPQQVVSYPPTEYTYATVKPSAPPITQATPTTVGYMPNYTYAQMPQQQTTAWVSAPYQYQVYPPPQQQQRYYVSQPVQQQQPSAGMAFAGGMLAGAVLNNILDGDDPY